SLPIIGFDAIQDAKKYVDDGELFATMQQNPEGMGKIAIKIVDDFIEANSVQHDIFIDVLPYKKTRSSMVLKREINLYKTPNDVNVEREAIFEEQTFLIEEPGIYSIEGPNQVGKSVLIKLLVGALPPNFDKELSVSLTYINGKPQKINSVIDAINNGMVAVFQEETLVPTMTVREQILMRHSNPKIRVVSDQLIGRLWNE
ncbi:MAG TPA: hypothetical protein DCE80_01325, partial [Ignavibacteriales bacterium]|nr:hypothetical protein [Ignavibacteriales bacterium]